MCGVTGILSKSATLDHLGAVVQCMADTIVHRGPDDGGVWVDEAAGLALAHKRLSILDLTSAGHQPMHSACSRYVMVFNGEIYNHLDLRRDLGLAPTSSFSVGSEGGIRWRGHSDTETLLACIVNWGLEKTLKSCVGMFAIALWDRETRTLALARDRMGEKPLYYGSYGQMFMFASELKAIRAFPGFSAGIDRGVLSLLMRYNYVPEPYCIYEGFRKLPPGCWLELTAEQLGRGDPPEPRRYWSALEVAIMGARNPYSFGSDTEAVSALDEKLREAVRMQMVADVPLGAFLSGGVDSSTVVALMQAESSRRVKTFSIGFHEGDYDEAHHAKAVARHLGTEHTELYVTAEDALACIPKLPALYDEPFSDSSQIPTHLVSQMARKHVAVSLSGDGGDELFGGYARYFLAAKLWGKLGRIPPSFRQVAASVIRTLSPGQWDLIYRMVAPGLPKSHRARSVGDRLHKGAAVLAGRSGADLYRGLVSHWDPAEIVLGAAEPDTAFTQPWPELSTLTEQMMALDAVTYLPGDILTKVDRAAMAVSLETRVPLLDHRVFEFAWRLPMNYKVRGGEGKWLLRQVLYQYVPRTLIDRPKMGFGVPIDSWLRGPLREWAEEMLDESRLRREGHFDPDPIRKKWQEHLSGRRNWQYLLWDVLMFQAWLSNIESKQIDKKR